MIYKEITNKGCSKWIKELASSSKLGNAVVLSKEEFERTVGPEIKRAIYRLLHPSDEQIEILMESKKRFEQVALTWEVITEAQ